MLNGFQRFFFSNYFSHSHFNSFSFLPLFPRILSQLLLLFAFLFSPSKTQADIVLTGGLGANSQDHFKGAHFAYNAGLFLKFDDQSLFGIQSGQGTVAASDAIPIMASAMIRLPIGRIVLPVATGDIGYAIGSKSVSNFIWRAGGGFDIRNGRRSSFLLLGAYERQGSLAGWMARVGILLEF